jgi:hypothetical protein
MMTSAKKEHFRAAFNDEQIGKIFVVISDDTRRCLICERVLPRRECAEHWKTICYPPASNSN